METILLSNYRSAGQGYNVMMNGESMDKAEQDKHGSFSEADLKRMYWHSRRGMLELDLLLVPFARDRLQSLELSQLDDYRMLLQEEDQDLWTWLTRREPAPSAALQRSIELVLQHNAGASKF